MPPIGRRATRVPRPRPTSVRVNAAANLSSQVIIGLLSMAALPWLIRVLGEESYAIAALFVAVQTWISLLDLGLGQALARQTARVRVKAIDLADYLGLYKAVTLVFIGGATFATITIALGSRWLATDWLNAEQLPPAMIARALALMGLASSLRWYAGLSRGVIMGHERFVWLSVTNTLLALARWVLVIPILIGLDTPEPLVTYMQYQVVLAIFEVVIFQRKARSLTRALDPRHAGSRTAPNWTVVRRQMSFSLNLAFSSVVWVMVTQSDRLTLSGILPLNAYAVFALATTLAGAIVMVFTPLGAVILPRLTQVAADDSHEALAGTYIKFTRTVALVVFPVGFTLAAVSEEFLRLWTNDPALSSAAAPITSVYCLGNIALSVTTFAFYLQYALGTMRLHTLASLMMALLLIPTQIALALRWGALGAAIAWAAVNFVYLLVWTPVVHRVYLRGTHSRWLIEGVLLPGVVIGGAVALARILLGESGPWPEAFVVGGTTLAALIASAILWKALPLGSPQAIARSVRAATGRPLP